MDIFHELLYYFKGFLFLFGVVFLYKFPQHSYAFVEVVFEIEAVLLALFDLVEVVIKGFFGEVYLLCCLL
jgi:hypothetical protein